jgi:hypothetical protein
MLKASVFGAQSLSSEALSVNSEALGFNSHGFGVNGKVSGGGENH